MLEAGHIRNHHSVEMRGEELGARSSDNQIEAIVRERFLMIKKEFLLYAIY